MKVILVPTVHAGYSESCSQTSIVTVKKKKKEAVPLGIPVV